MSDPRGQAGDARLGPPGHGPREFLAAAYDAFAPGLYRYALVVTADHAAAEDAVQQAFVNLAGMGQRVWAIESCERYLRTAVRNECWRIIERRRRESQHRCAAQVMPLLEAAPASPFDEDERVRVEAAMVALPPEQREVVYLKVYEDWTFQQIAEWLNVPMNTVASRYRYAIEKLRRQLIAEGIGEGGSDGPT